MCTKTDDARRLMLSLVRLYAVVSIMCRSIYTMHLQMNFTTCGIEQLVFFKSAFFCFILCLLKFYLFSGCSKGKAKHHAG